MSLQPITAYRNSPPVSGVGDKQLERTRREFLDLIKSDERRHEGEARRESGGQKSGNQQQNAQETARQLRIAADRRAQEPSFLPASTVSPRTTKTSATRPMRDGPAAPAQRGLPEGRDVRAGEPRVPADTSRPSTQEQIPAAATGRPALSPAPTRVPSPAPWHAPERQPGPNHAPQPVDARSQQPLPPAGTQLVAPASSAGEQDAGQVLQGFRLSNQVPREVAERIAQFMRTGSLNRDPFSFAPMNHVLEAEAALTPEQKADLAVASLIEEAAPHMRLSESVLMERDPGEGGLFASAQTLGTNESASAQAAIRAQAALHPPTLVPTAPQAQPARSTVSRGDANPLFGPSGGDLFAPLGENEDSPIDLIAGPREIRPRMRIA